MSFSPGIKHNLALKHKKQKQACNSLVMVPSHTDVAKLPAACQQGKCVIYKYEHAVKCQDAFQSTKQTNMDCLQLPPEAPSKLPCV